MDEADAQVPRSARIWNYWMGGQDNLPVDREAGDAWTAIQPDIVRIARSSRGFLVDAVHYLAAEAGIRQFLDVGAGLPFTPGQNTHEVARAAAPDARIVYVDNDPRVLERGRAALGTTPDGSTTYVDADYHAPDGIVARARELLDFDRPIAVMFMGVLGHVADYSEARDIVSRVFGSTPAGSHLVLWENTDTTGPARAAAAEYVRSGAVPYRLCTPDQVGGFFDGLGLVEPGLVPLNQWRRDDPAPIDAYTAVGVKSG